MINRVILTGRLARDPELRKTQSGLSVCSFQLAVDRPKQKGQDDAVTDWISCQVWRQAADYICNYAKKGALLAVDGRLQTRSYDNASGQKVHVTEVVCERVEIQRQASTQAGKQQTRSNQGTQYAENGGFANTYTSSGYQDPFADDYGSGPTLDISSDDLPFN
jgi:single-strand DNA-binding protein|nr:MAG TPA: Single strand binding protein [Caudoviricetes sp.]